MSNSLRAILSEIRENWLEVFSLLRLASSGSGVRSITAANFDFMFHLLIRTDRRTSLTLPALRGVHGSSSRQIRMMGEKGLSRQGGIRNTEISVEPNERKPRDYDSLPCQEMMPLRTAYSTISAELCRSNFCRMWLR